MRRNHSYAIVLAVLTLLATFCGQAAADTTHPYLGDITLSGVKEANVIGVDPNGNLLVWLEEQHALARFDTNGNPVPFSALGTNVIDGAGTGHCPAVPADCDEVPTNGFLGSDGTGETVERNGVLAAVDTSGGAADGYIYIENINDLESEEKGRNGQTDVFNSDGEFLGIVDVSGSRPIRAGGLRVTTGIAVSSTGTLVLSETTGFAGTNAVMYVPVNGTPEDDQFAGQFFSPCQDTSCQGAKYTFFNTVISPNFIYTNGAFFETNHESSTYGLSSQWVKIPLSEAHHPRVEEPAAPVNLEPDNLVFGDGGSGYHTAMVDPATNDVYLGRSGPSGEGNIQQWTETNNKVGPNFGLGHLSKDFNGNLTMGIDRTGGPNDGHIYAKGLDPAGNKIAVFGGPIHIPDLTNPSATTAHTSAHVTVDIGLDSGPQVNSCTVEYGFDTNYGFTKPCSPPTPYLADTQASADLTGLLVGETYHYRVTVGTANGPAVSKDAAFRTSAVLDVQTLTATALTQTGAALNGSLNPDGISPTTYWFEYGIDTNYTDSTPKRGAPAGTSTLQLPAEVIGGLQRGRKYHFRLVASNSLGTTFGGDQAFIVPAAPAISSLAATNILASSADLTARLTGFDSPTTYHFEYGTSTLYGGSSPDVDLPASGQIQPVSTHVTDLQPGVTYHFRIVATNDWGTTSSADSTVDFLPPNCPNSHVRQLTNGNYLPDCRAYELVSPSAAGNVSLFPGSVTVNFGTGFFQGNPLFLVESPNALGLASSPPRFAFYGGQGAIAGLDPPDTLIDRYVSTRTNDGWVTTYPGRQGDDAFMASRPKCDYQMTTCIDFWPSDVIGFNPNPLPGSNAPYVWDTNGKSLGRWPTNLGAVKDGEGFVGDTEPSPDFSHFFFSSRDNAFAPGATANAPGSAYDNDIGAATVEVISKLPNGSPIPPDPAAGGDETGYIHILGTSFDGSRVLMAPPTEPFCGTFNCFPPSTPVRLYMRVNDAVSYDVSQGASARLVGMTRNGTKVVFSTTANLSPADTDGSSDIYVWSEADPNHPVPVALGNGNGNSDSCNASWTSGCDVQPLTPERPQLDNVIAPGNGDVYFYSPEQLDSLDPGVRNQRNVYVYRDGQVRYVTTLDPGRQIDRIQVSPDGSHMAFLTRSQVTQYDNQSWEEMYTWDPASGRIACASCLPSGQPPTLGHKEPCFQCTKVVKDVTASESGPFMTDDGRVGFATTDALVPGDTNRTIDVYEFSGDRARLVSAGTGDRIQQGGAFFYPGLDTGFEGFSADGIDMYFSTFDTLVPQDRNGSFVKFYDARTNGGFPATPPRLPCTAADECHGDSSVPTTAPTVGTGARLGAGGNVVSNGVKKKKKKKKRHSRRHRNRHQARQGGAQHG